MSTEQRARKVRPAPKGPGVVRQLAGMPFVREAWQDGDGYWVVYDECVVSTATECNREHEYTAREILSRVRETVRAHRRRL